MALRELIDRLARDHWLTTGEYERLLSERTAESARILTQAADRQRRDFTGTRIHLRGILDVTSICGQDCALCPRRKSADCPRFRLRPREILECCEDACSLELRTLVIRCGGDSFYTDKMLCGLVERLHRSYPDCNLALAAGERSRKSMEKLYNAGFDGYVLLQETADRGSYDKTHLPPMTWEKRIHCLNELRDVGLRCGCGFALGLPGQGPAELARELKFLEEFQPEGVELLPLGPVDPELAAYLISILRLSLPNALISASGDPVRQVLAGANGLAVGITAGSSAFPLCGGSPAEGPATIPSLAALRRELAEVGFEIDPARWSG